MSSAVGNLFWPVATLVNWVVFISQPLLCVFLEPQFLRNRLLLHLSRFMILLSNELDFDCWRPCDTASATGFCMTIQIVDMSWPWLIADWGNVERYSTSAVTFQLFYWKSNIFKYVQIVSLKDWFGTNYNHTRSGSPPVFRQVILILELCTFVFLFSKQRGSQVCLPWYVASFVCIEVQAKGNRVRSPGTA